MAVRIRLSRIGKKHVPIFRVVAVDSRKKRDGAILANIGTYDALNTSVVRFDEGLYQEWVAKGALPTDSALKIYRLFKKGAQAPEKVEKKVKKPVEKAVEVKEAKEAAEKKVEATPVATPSKEAGAQVKEATEAKEAAEKKEDA